MGQKKTGKEQAGFMAETGSASYQPTLMAFQEFQSGAAWSPILLAGAALAVSRDGKPRKRSREEWEHAVQVFASTPSP